MFAMNKKETALFGTPSIRRRRNVKLPAALLDDQKSRKGLLDCPNSDKAFA